MKCVAVEEGNSQSDLGGWVKEWDIRSWIIDFVPWKHWKCYDAMVLCQVNMLMLKGNKKFIIFCLHCGYCLLFNKIITVWCNNDQKLIK